MNKRNLSALGLLAAGLAGLIMLEARNWFKPSLRSRMFYLLLQNMAVRDLDSVPELREQAETQLSRLPMLEGTALEPVTAGSVPAEWITPAAAVDGRVLLYLHGGAYVSGSVNCYRGLISTLAAAGESRTLAVDYRLAPEHPFPAAVDDAVAAYRWLLAEGTPSDQIMIAGDSAGGGLTLATLMALRDAGDPLPAGAVLLSPWTDLAGTGGSIQTQASADPVLNWTMLDQMAAAYAGPHDRRDPLISPYYGDLANLPPLLIQVGSREILLHDSTRLVARVIAAGGEATLHVGEGLWHVWPMVGNLIPESGVAIEQIGAFVSTHMQAAVR